MKFVLNFESMEGSLLSTDPANTWLWILLFLQVMRQPICRRCSSDFQCNSKTRICIHELTSRVGRAYWPIAAPSTTPSQILREINRGSYLFIRQMTQAIGISLDRQIPVFPIVIPHKVFVNCVYNKRFLTMIYLNNML